MTVPTVKPRDCQPSEAGQPFHLIDVRTPAEFAELHAEGARLLPLDKLDAQAFKHEVADGGGAAVYLLCRTGDRSKRAAQRLHEAGLEQVYVVEGGTEAWEAAGLPVQRGRKTISLERQVRIGAGSLVVIGVALGAWLHPLFLLIAALVGGGLVFAGVTDTCGMALMLARMPWNQRGACKTTAESTSGARHTPA
jgi:rhodanese-related sulfurtransferase